MIQDREIYHEVKVKDVGWGNMYGKMRVSRRKV